MKRITVVGGGISGLSAAYLIEKELEEKSLKASVELLEAENRLGGKIRSERDSGYIVEWGPNGFLDNKPWTLELCESLGITGRLLPSRDEARKRYIYSEGELHRLSESPQAFFLSDLLSIPGRLRIIGELWARKKPENVVDETLADFARRRLGREAYEKMLDPMVSGIFAGNPEEMSLVSSFPRIAELEREYGGLIRAMIKIQKRKKKEKKARKDTGPEAGPSGPGGVLTSFREGLEEFIGYIEKGMKGPAVTGFPVESLEENNGRYILTGPEGKKEADIVVLAVPAYEGAKIMKKLESGISKRLNRIPYSPLAVAAFGGPKEDIEKELDGFGFLIPGREKREILGSLWTSSIFPNRAPGDNYLLRTMIGGAKHPEILPFDEKALKHSAEKELKDIVGLNEPPEYVSIIPHEKAIPQYTVGHGADLEAMKEILKKRPGIFLTGNAFRGIGLNDCVKSSMDTAEKVIDHIRGRT